jgi:RimJ/RimL family protein N-acetyltransferase
VSQFHWPSSPPILTGGSLRLRAWDPKDADAVFAACQDPGIQRWTRVPAPYEPQHAAGFVGELAASQWAAGTGAPLAVATAADDEIVGACGLVAVNAQDLVAEVGYWVVPWARGQRVAQRATRLLAGWAFTDVGFERLELYIEPANTTSCTVAERLGCEREGVLRSKAVVRNQRRDMALYALVKR